MKKIFGILFIVVVLIVAILATPSIVRGDALNECPDGWVAKYESSADGVIIDGKTVTFPQEVTFCVKAGSLANSGILTGTSYTVDFLNDGGQIPNISHVVIYSYSNTPTPTNTLTPDPTFTPTPTTVITETETPTATPVPTLPIPHCDDCDNVVQIMPTTGHGNFWHDLLYWLLELFK